MNIPKKNNMLSARFKDYVDDEESFKKNVCNTKKNKKKNEFHAKTSLPQELCNEFAPISYVGAT